MSRYFESCGILYNGGRILGLRLIANQPLSVGEADRRSLICLDLSHTLS
jgi:hypothetical protein